MDDNEATRSSPANEEGRATEGEAIASLASTAAETPDKAATEDYNRKRRLETGNDDEKGTPTDRSNSPPPKTRKLNRAKTAPLLQFGRKRRRKRRNTIPGTNQPKKPIENDSSDEDLPAISEMMTLEGKHICSVSCYHQEQ
jgi:hypothetical protein